MDKAIEKKDLSNQFEFARDSFKDGVSTIRALDFKSNVIMIINIFLLVSVLKVYLSFPREIIFIGKILFVAYLIFSFLTIMAMIISILARFKNESLDTQIAELGNESRKII